MVQLDGLYNYVHATLQDEYLKLAAGVLTGNDPSCEVELRLQLTVW